MSAAVTVGANKNGDKQAKKTAAAAAAAMEPSTGVDVRAMRRVMIERWDAKQTEAKRRWAAATPKTAAARGAATPTPEGEGTVDGGPARDGHEGAVNHKARKNVDVDPPDTTLEWRLDGQGGARGERLGVLFAARYAWILRYRTITHRAYEPSRDDDDDDGSVAPPQRLRDGAAAKTMRVHMLEWAREWPTEVPPAMLAAMTKIETANSKRKARNDASDSDDNGDDGEEEEEDEKDEGGKRRRRAKFGKRRRLSRETGRGRRGGADGDDDDDDCCNSSNGSDSSDDDGLVGEEAFERAERRQERERGGDSGGGDAKLESQIDPDVLDLVQRQPRLATDAIDPPPSCGSLIPFTDAVFADELAWRLAAFGHMCRLDAYIRETTKAGYTYHIGLYDVTRTSTGGDGSEVDGTAEAVSAPLAAGGNDRVVV